MEELIYEIDNWSIVKLLGGFAIILTAIIGFSFKFFTSWLNQYVQHNYTIKLEDIRGEISKNNSILNSAIQNYFLSTQKILDKKIEAYEMLWSSVLAIKDGFPADISLIYQLFPSTEFQKASLFDEINSNPNIGSLLYSIDINSEMARKVNHNKALVALKPYISENSYKLFYTYQGLIGRVTFKFISDYRNKKIYDWKTDTGLDEILNIALTEKELVHIKGINVAALSVLLDLLEYKILQDFRNSFNIKATSDDTISHIKDIEKILNLSQSKSTSS